MPGKESRDCVDDTSREEELAHLRNTLRRNGYGGNGYPKQPQKTAQNSLTLTQRIKSTQTLPAICPGRVREHSKHVQKDRDSNCFQVQRHPQTAPDECEDSHTRIELEGSCVSDSMPGL